MTNLYQAKVTIAGATIAGAWEGDDLVALDQLQVTWGRQSVYDDNVPSSLSLSVIDPDGDWASTQAIIGEVVEVWRLAPDTRMFLGRIADVSLRRVQVTHPVLFTQVSVWIADLTCTDVLTDLDQLLINDPNLKGAADGKTSIGVASLGIAQRVDQLMSLGTQNIVASIQPAITPLLDTSGLYAAVQSHGPDEELSALEIIAKYYNTLPFTHVNYNPVTNGIEAGAMANNDGIALALISGVIELVPVTALVLDAATVKIPELEANSQTASQIDQVVVPFWGTVVVGVASAWHSTVVNTARYNPSAKGQRVFTSNSDMEQGTGGDDAPDIYTVNLATEIVAIVNVLNGRFHVAGLQYDYRRFGSAGSTLDAVLLDTKSQAQAIYFQRSILNRIHHCGPMHQLIGGKLTWFNKVIGSSLDAGWVVDMNLAPTTGQLPTVTLATLSTNATARLMDFDPDLTLNDIAHVTTGLT